MPSVVLWAKRESPTALTSVPTASQGVITGLLLSLEKGKKKSVLGKAWGGLYRSPQDALSNFIVETSHMPQNHPWIAQEVPDAGKTFFHSRFIYDKTSPSGVGVKMKAKKGNCVLPEKKNRTMEKHSPQTQTGPAAAHQACSVPGWHLGQPVPTRAQQQNTNC
ncbi:hypothetical protein GWK47_012981 [Chionoecetes opilio]|uniref:Uncharacterized protein n=1 Tax=Chionoecetes opilio TaxID=41210 RepID=A0A8J5CLP4_CHIOP|nr:hypothetical protein GWK47_012981 [Chionoecetes opilio]